MATIAVGSTHVLRRVLQALPDVLARPVANLERIAVVKHDGDLLEPLPLIEDSGEGDPPVWMALRVYTRQSAHADGGAVYTTLTRRLREAAAAGVTTLRGESVSRATSCPSATASAPSQATLRPARLRRAPGRGSPRSGRSLIEIADPGSVTAALVPAYRERAGEVEHGRKLTVRSATTSPSCTAAAPHHRPRRARRWPAGSRPNR